MKKRITLIAIFCTLLIVTACGKKKEPSIIGTWKNTGTIVKEYVFNEDGSGVLKYNGFEIKFTYTLTEDRLTIVTSMGSEQTKEYNVTLSEDRLMMDSKIEKLELQKQ